MADSYLNKTGLAYFWTKIKAYVSSLLSNVVHTTGNESISGIKVFNGNIAERRVSLAKGEAPSENLYYNFVFVDNNSTTFNIGVANRFGGLETQVSTNKDTSTYLIAYQNAVGSANSVILGVTTNSTYDSDFRYAYVRNGHFKLFGGYDYICVAGSDFIRGTAPSTTLYAAPLKFMDANGNTFSQLYCVYGTDKLNYISFLVAKGTDTSNTTEQLGIGFNGAGDVFTRCPNPSDDSNTNNIATTNWVRRIINKSPVEFRRKYTTFTRGTAPSSNMYYWLVNGLDNEEHIVSGVYGEYTTSRANSISLIIYKGTTTDSEHVSISIGYDGSGDWYTSAPTPDTSSNNTYIATTAFVKNQDYATRTTAQTITGTKTFTSAIVADNIIRRSSNTGSLSITGASGTGAIDGGKIVLRGSSDSVGTAGEAVLQGGDSSGYRYISIRPDTIYVANNGFVFDKYHGSFILRFAEDYPNSGASIFAGTQNFDGAGLILYGRTQDSANNNHGKFYLRASRRSSSSGTEATRTLTGTPDGSIYWNGQAIQTSSDERLKTDFASVDDSILDGWDNVNWIQFKYKDAVAEKGTNARYHVGLVAQHVSRQFENLETQIERYGIVCHEYEKEHYIESTVVDAQAYTDGEGVYHEEQSHVEREFMPGRDEWTVRYTEALCMEAAYMRRENARLKKRVADLEERLAALELKIA